MFDALRQLPADAASAYQVGLNASHRPAGAAPNAVLLVESLGSMVGDLLEASLSPHLSVPFVKSDSPLLPAFVRPETLVIVSSVTGREPESVDVIDRVLAAGGVPFVISPWGEPAEIATAKGLPLADMSHWAASTGHGAGVEIAYFAALGAIAASQGEPGAALKAAGQEALGVIARQREAYAPEVPETANPTRALAGALRGQNVALVCGSPLARVAAGYAQMRLESLASLPCWRLSLPDNWLQPSETGCAILLRDQDDPAYYAERIEAAREKLGVPMHELQMDGSSAIARLWSTLTLIDWAAFYLAP